MRESKSSDCELAKRLLSFIDLTSLNSLDTYSEIESFVEKVNLFQERFPTLPNVAAICLYPNFTSRARRALKVEGVKIAVVGGAFPSAQSFLEVKLLECKMAVEQGADEVDITIPLSFLLEGEFERTKEEIAAIKGVIGEATLKVILESGLLESEELINKASKIALEGGADFLKTSTGKGGVAATPEAAAVICRAILEHYKESGKKVGFKPAGGISTFEEALRYYTIVQTILGDEWLNRELFRIGASRLANNLLTQLEGREIKYF